jgi:hypothetical protein
MKRCLLLFFVLACALPSRAVTFAVTYGDGPNEGFNDPTLGAMRRNAFEAAASQWSQMLEGTVPVRVNAFFDPLGGNVSSAVLGFAGPTALFENWQGTPRADTFYAVALANQLAQTDLDSTSVDITITFNSDVDNSSVLGSSGFYYGTDTGAGSDVDFYTVALHELTHGLGFLDTINPDGSLFNAHPSIYDTKLATGATAESAFLLELSQASRPAVLTGGNLFFSGPNTREANGGLNARLYAPPSFEANSSVSHLDETTFSPPPDGSAPDADEELLTPASTVDTHIIGPVLQAMLRDLGWGVRVELPRVSISDVAVNEGNSGTTTVTLNVSLSAPSDGGVRVNYATANAGATAGSDYVAQSGTLIFAPGQTSRQINISLLGDTTSEANETFFVNLNNPVACEIEDGQGTVTILNDDAFTNVMPFCTGLSTSTFSSATGVKRTFIATYNDGNGAGDITQAIFQAGNSPAASNALRCFYDAFDNKLYLRNDTDTAWLGGFEPGSANNISNSQGTLFCANTSVLYSGNDLVVSWTVAAASQWAGLRPRLYLSCIDQAGLSDLSRQFGTWTLTGNLAPTNTSLAPTAMTQGFGAQRKLTAVYTDRNTARNLSQAMLRIGAPGDGFEVYYDVVNNRLFVRNDAGTGWLGGFAPGAARTISNSRGSLSCANTTVSLRSNSVKVIFAITLTGPASWKGTTQNVALYCRDRGQLEAPYANFGTWTIP